MKRLLPLAMAFCTLAFLDARADDGWSLHGQATNVWQYHPAFRAPYGGAYSMDGGSRSNETFDATLFAGARLWDGGEAYANGEIDQGFGLSNTQGAAAFPSGEAYKVGKSSPYFRLQRLFLRQSFDLGGDSQAVADGPNQVAGSRTADNLVLTAGKFSVTDIFDNNAYAHDPKGDFLNWALIDAGAFDYAADAWGYSYGVAGEWTTGAWTVRAGLFDLSRVPNTTALTRGFGQYELVAELERRFTLLGQDGRIKLLGFVNRGRMGGYDDAVALALATGAAADTALVRRPADRSGVSVNLEQGLTDELGFFLRASLNDGSKETFEFTDMNRSLAAGLSLKGTVWGRKNDTVGLGLETSAVSHAAQAYFAHGGLGLLIGDGALPHYDGERVLESYYDVGVTPWLHLAADYQLILNPGYNADRGPISVLGARVHTVF